MDFETSEASAPPGVSFAELQLATRNHGMPLEALQWPITPIGLHYLLTHYDIPVVDPADWRLTISGCVERPMTLSLTELGARERRDIVVTMECAGNGRSQLSPRPLSQPWIVEAVGTARWTGTPLRGVLEAAGLTNDAVHVVFHGLDRGFEAGVEQRFERALSVPDALRDDVLLADTVNGQPLPPQHGFPLRLIVPGWYGMTNVKWLTEITVLDEEFSGYQQATSYRMRAEESDPGKPLTWMAPRSLMVPPGIPDFFTRQRFLTSGRHRLTGRAWSGRSPIAAVDISIDGGESWNAADLDEAAGPWQWRGWSYEWHADEPGVYELISRARDQHGDAQPLEPPWNLGGYANNAVQRLVVEVNR